MVERENDLDGPTVRRIGRERRTSALLPSDAAWSADDGDRTPGENDPIDFVAVQADDALLDTLRSSDSVDGGIADPELSALLLSWRREVDSESIGELVDLDTAVATINAAKARRRPRNRLLIPLASAAAVLAIAFTGVGLAARDAQPGDALWGLAKVLYSDHTRSVEAAASAREDLTTAALALRHGNYNDAAAALTRAVSKLEAVAVEDGAAALIDQHQSLVKQLVTSSPGTPPPPPVNNTSVSPPPPTQNPSSPSTTQQSNSNTSPTTTTQPPATTTTTPPTTTTVPTTTTPSTTDSTTGSNGAGTGTGTGTNGGTTEGSARSGGGSLPQSPSPPAAPSVGG
ncbi:anti-sigma-D factor RsdA [Allokutzneria oryzae]|uniref:Anti-sigma-D factor RsdA n=1 Tax=Allokutzneria oryzae TaxID=1378989 RepID=A0ABV6A372_9PSEU